MTLEQKLIHALKSKDSSKIINIFEEIYNSYGKIVYFIISQYVNNQLDVEELTQDVFVNFYNSLNKTTIKNVKYYLVKSAKNRALDFLKQKKEQILFDENCIYEQLDMSNSNQKYQEIIELMKKFLNEFEIEIILKHLIYEYSFKEIAKYYKKPLNTVLSTYHRAIKKFKERNRQDEK